MPDVQPKAEPRDFDALLEYLKRTRGFDFNAYKPPNLLRRLRKRLHAVHCQAFSDYVDYLEVHPEEFGRLFDAVLINVTGFFRDEGAWEFLRDEVVPRLVSGDGPIRIWSAGCASGEEAYSIAMLLSEAIGRKGFRDRVKIYATDVDDPALDQAHAASYTNKQLITAPRSLVGKYFVQEGDRFVFDKALRRSVVFGRHDLIQDAPISRVNLIICRNTLVYFNAEAQARILTRFHFALAPGGVLFLGKGELLTHSQLFTPIDRRRRIFQKVSKDAAFEANQRQLDRSNRNLETAYEELRSINDELESTNEELQSTVEELQTTNEELQSTNEELETMNEELQSTNEELQTLNHELRGLSEELRRANSFFESILAGLRGAVVVLDRELHVLAWSHRAEDLWGLRSDEVKGQNFLNLDIGLPVDRVRAAIRSCVAGDGELNETVVAATNRRGKPISCKVTVSPLHGSGHDIEGAILLMEEPSGPIN